MAMSTELCGVFLMAASGVVVTLEMVISKVVEEWQWPYWDITGYTCVVAVLIVAPAIWCSGIEVPKCTDLKWVVARSLFGCAQWTLAILAVLIGAAPGDVAALTSIDIVAAALLGLCFLRERVTVLHLLALICSVVGAVLISKPEFLFGAPDGTSHRSPFGYCLALLSGVLQAAAFVCARKSVHIPVGLLSLTSMLMSVLIAFLLPLVPGIANPGWQPVLAAPWKAIAVFLGICLTTFLSLTMPAAGATRCPAAVSATVYTSSSMLSGYVAQTMLFDNVPTPLTLLGAAFMLLSVVLMAMPTQQPEEEEPKNTDPTGHAPAAAADGDDSEETMSLGSFVASEVSWLSAGSQGHVRRRLSFGRSSSSAEDPNLAQRIGAALTVVELSA